MVEKPVGCMCTRQVPTNKQEANGRHKNLDVTAISCGVHQLRSSKEPILPEVCSVIGEPCFTLLIQPPMLLGGAFARIKAGFCGYLSCQASR